MEAYRINEGAALYYLTFSVIDWLPVFVCEEPCLIVTDSLNFSHREKCLRVNAFVIMPTHLHLILFDAYYDSQRLQRTITDLRKYTRQRLSDYCEHKMPSAFSLRRYASQPSTRRPSTPVLAAKPAPGSDLFTAVLADKGRLSAR
jgi:putative transposase